MCIRDRDNSGKTALMYSCLLNHEDLASYLVKFCNANTNLYDKFKETALHYAVSSGHLNLVKLLVEEGQANIKMKNDKGKTPVDLVVHESIKEYFKICLLYTYPSPRDLSTSRMPSSA
eukprot:TRINITY_DN19080_c0_g1_i1.p1 TRINITY_DN19080_c0_g1~~TRINITY_DN19080_c0_g1_i1.p1  ORF type:complete len:118 (+),score=37.15 TRINITY_DN19080_c0_g1_i1:63-416(+)